MYRGGRLIQVPIQDSRDAERVARHFEEGRRLLNISKAAFPENELIRMYLDEPMLKKQILGMTC